MKIYREVNLKQVGQGMLVEGPARAKALGQDPAWCVEGTAKKAPVAGAE